MLCLDVLDQVVPDSLRVVNGLRIIVQLCGVPRFEGLMFVQLSLESIDF